MSDPNTRQPTYTRRQIVTMVGATAATAAAWKAGLIGRGQTISPVSESRVLMGTIVNLTVLDVDRQTAQTAVSATLAHMAELEAILSRHDTHSELSRLNKNGTLRRASQSLLEVVNTAQTLGDLSGGAFDITIKPLLDVYQTAHTRGQLPPDTAVAGARALVNYQNVILEGTAITLARPGMGITLDGIGKGYIIDAGTAVLRQHGFANVLVEAGGDLLASGVKDNARLWRVGVQSPRPELQGSLAKLALKDQAAATSGDYMQPFTADFSQHHILDPRTGMSAPELASVTVTAPSAMLADGLATAVAVLGSHAGLTLINQLPHTEAYLVTKEAHILRTNGFGGEAART